MSQSGSYTASGGGGGSVNTLTGNTGGAVGPTGNNINVVGTGAITVAGNPGTSALTISTSGITANSFPTDSGTATPSLGVLNVLGGSNIGTTGSGNTVTVNLDNTISVSGSVTAGTGVTSTTGNIVASAGQVTAATGITVGAFGRGIVRSSSAGAFSSINGTNGQVIIAATGADPIWASLTAGSGISITPGANSISIAATGGGSGIATLDGDTGSATGATVTIAGGSNITTSATGSTVTVDLDSTVSIGGSMTAGTGFTATTGDVTITAGNLNLPLTSTGFTAGTINFGGTASLYFFNGSLYLGIGAGNSTTSGVNNTVVGDDAASLITGFSNTFVGRQSALSLTSGTHNTGLGTFSLSGLISGARNVCIGYNSGAIYSGAESDNICISTLGTLGDNATIRIGTPATHTSSFMAGAYGVTPASSPEMMTIGSNGELGSQAIPGGGGIGTLDGDTGSATGATVTIAGGTGITTSATGATVTIDNDGVITINGDSGSATGNTITIAGGTNVTTSATGSTVTINASSSGGLTWSEVTGSTQAMAVGNGYILNNAGGVTATLPATAAVGTTMRITGKGSGGWTLQANGGQTVQYLSQVTSSGGTIVPFALPADRYSSLELLCITADTTFSVIGSSGNFTVA